MKAIIIAALAGLCWGVGELFTKAVLHTGKIGPITAIAVRSTVALPVLWIVYAVMVHGRSAEPTNWLHAGAPTLSKLVIGSGLIAGALGMIFFYLAISMAEVSRVKPVAFSVAPACAVFLAWIFLGEPLTVRKVIGLLLVVGGVLLLTGRTVTGEAPVPHSP